MSATLWAHGYISCVTSGLGKWKGPASSPLVVVPYCVGRASTGFLVAASICVHLDLRLESELIHPVITGPS